MAVIIPFPRVRDRRFVWRLARRMAALNTTTSDKHLAYSLRVQVETMRRRGISEDLIQEQRVALEVAVRCELNRLYAIGGVA